MSLIQRIGYYLGGFSIGLVILAFFLNGKKTSCAYGPEARVLKAINSKTLYYTPTVHNKIDTSLIKKLLKTGSVVFSKSDSRKKPCGMYTVESELEDKDLFFSVENCDSLVKILDVTFKE
jgi:ABC-type molybdate transport system substrate-binding protein